MGYYNKISATQKNIFTPTPDGSEALILKDLAENADKGVVHVCKNDLYLEKTLHALEFFTTKTKITTLPAWDVNPYDNTSPSNGVVSERLKALSEIAEGLNKNHILLTTANALIKRNLPKEIIKNSTLSLKKGDEVKRDELTGFLVNNSYINVGAASDCGEFSIRGSIIDIHPPNEEFGIRIDFFGDEIESLRKYDPLTQISKGEIKEFNLIPASEIILNQKNIERFKENFIQLFGINSAKENPLFEAVAEGRKFAGMENFLPIFYDNTDTIFDYCKDALISFENDLENVLHERWEQIEDSYNARNIFVKSGRYEGVETNLLEPDGLYISENDLHNITLELTRIEFRKFDESIKEDHIKLNFRNSKNYFADSKIQKQTPIDLLKKDLVDDVLNKKSKNLKTIIACVTEGSRDRIANLLKENEVENLYIDDLSKAVALKGNLIGLAVIPIEHGFKADDLRFISESDLLGERIYRRQRKTGKAEDFLKEVSNLNSGELVVHKEHGIGRFEGLTTLEVNNIQHDFILLTYRDGDKFYVPIENIEMISRYGSEEGAELDKLGGAAWQERTARVKKHIREIAKDLISIAANREIKKAKTFGTAHGPYDEFVAKFPYVETEDQMHAISDVISDLSSGKAMDRLICGDVGFGKTEVALRAAFTVVQNNDDKEKREQVAVICPTTLLCRQHYNTFKQRFAGNDFKIKQLSRMVSSTEAKNIKQEIEEGNVDIVIGTHALLSKNIEFDNLSLLIIDEEQRFGVTQKERLKKLKDDTHVLTLSATPIPRTLQLSLSGIRDLSLIATPPVDRLAVRTYVMPFDQITIREAILKEHYRGGKTYFVAPKIKDLDEIEPKLKELIPEVKIVKAHGGMKADELDKIMNDFYEDKFDVLLSTTIVESGLDVPTANTMIIHRADMFGLAQLYQLRGRIGRGKIRAYAYLTIPKRKKLTKQAEKRLEVMQKLDTLGAGFTLASYDMDIRGFGNLLGDEQSGNIREVGVELYQNMLKEAIEGLKALNEEREEELKDDYSVKLNLGIPVLIPDNYVADSDLRMGLYRRLGNIEDEQGIESFASELVDRFGKIPEEVENLFDTIKIKLICKKLDIDKIDAGESGAKIQFHNDEFQNADTLISLITKNPIKYKIKEGNKFVMINREWKKPEARISGLKKDLNNILEFTKEQKDGTAA